MPTEQESDDVDTTRPRQRTDNASPGAADGVLSAVYLKDPADPQWDDDPAMVEFQEQGQAHGLSAEQVEDGVVGIGWTFGQLLAETIRNTPELTRENIMQSAYSLDGVEVVERRREGVAGRSRRDAG